MAYIVADRRVLGDIGYIPIAQVRQFLPLDGFAK